MPSSNPAILTDKRLALDAVVVLIPAYQPGEPLVESVNGLLASGVSRIVVVNDGSSSGIEVFEQLRHIPGCEIVEHSVNLGKGRALKSGFNHIYLRHRDCRRVVTADADGQHTVKDIVQVATASLAQDSSLMIGARSFSKDVPLRSLIGNVISRHILRIVTGLKLADTQSGLRAIPMGLMPHLMRLEGEQYEYEMNMLLSMRDMRFSIRETPITTVYLENNRSSHFNPIFDSMKIYFLLLRFAFTSLCTSGIDQLLFFVAWKSGLSIAASMVAGRLGSSIFNLSMNRQFVFKSSGRFGEILFKYYAAMALAGVVAFSLIKFLTATFGWPVPLAKVVVETALFLISFLINRDFIFTSSTHAQEQHS